MNTETTFVEIRQETEADRKAVGRVVLAAFAGISESDQSEHLLIDRLRRSDQFIPELSLVAEIDDQIVGHILLSIIHVVEGTQRHPSLALAPVSVHPEYQGRGIGARLITAAHDKARQMGFGSVILLGHAEYYPRFGYRKASEYGIRLPFDVPDENCMAVELIPGSLAGVVGRVEYPPEFF